MDWHIKIWALIIALCIITAMLGGCARQENQAENGILNIYATFYPLYACAQMVAGDVPNVHLSCLVQPQDGCLRDYQLSDWDYILLQRSADLIICGGRGLESFEDVLYSMGDDGPAVACALYNMEFSDNPKVAHIDADSESHWLDPNPHIYMCIDGMISIAESICAQLCMVDADNAQQYQHNFAAARIRLENLSEEMHRIVGDIEGKDVILMNEALTYLADEYHLNVVYSVNRDSGEAFHDVELADCITKLIPYRDAVILIEKQAPEAFTGALKEAGFTVAPMDILSTRSARSGDTGYFDAQLMNAQNLAATFHMNRENDR